MRKQLEKKISEMADGHYGDLGGQFNREAAGYQECGKDLLDLFMPFVETIRDKISCGPGYPLDDCPKCNAAEITRKALSDLKAKLK